MALSIRTNSQIESNWNLNTDNAGTRWANEFKIMYENFRAIRERISGSGKLGETKIMDDETAPDPEWFGMCSPSGEIAAAYDSALPAATGWPELVAYWRKKKVREPLTVDSDGIANSSMHSSFPVQAARFVTVSNKKYIALVLAKEAGDTEADMSGRALNAIAEHNLATGRYPVLTTNRDIVIGSNTFTAGEYSISSISTSNVEILVPFSYGSAGGIGFSSNRPSVSLYPHRILGQTEKAWHYSRAGMSLVGAGGQNYSGGLVRRGRMQGHKHNDSGHAHNATAYHGGGYGGNFGRGDDHNNRGNISTATGYASLGNPTAKDHGTPLHGKWTQPRSMAGFLYIYGGRKLSA